MSDSLILAIALICLGLYIAVPIPSRVFAVVTGVLLALAGILMLI